MTIYRPKVEITLPGERTETFFATFATLFPTFKCNFDKQEAFVNQAKFLYLTSIVEPNESLDHITVDDLQSNVTYKKLSFHPVRDLIGRIISWCQYRI